MQRCNVDRVKDATALSQKLIFLTILGWAGAASAQTWTPALQLTDGSILIQEFQTPNWWKLTPTNKAKYHGGKLTKVASFPASMNYAPEFFASAVLPDQFNGLSQGAAFGDDAQSATNYPLVLAGIDHQQCDRAQVLCPYARPQYHGGGDGKFPYKHVVPRIAGDGDRRQHHGGDRQWYPVAYGGYYCTRTVAVGLAAATVRTRRSEPASNSNRGPKEVL